MGGGVVAAPGAPGGAGVVSEVSAEAIRMAEVVRREVLDYSDLGEAVRMLWWVGWRVVEARLVPRTVVNALGERERETTRLAGGSEARRFMDYQRARVENAVLRRARALLGLWTLPLEAVGMAPALVVWAWRMVWRRWPWNQNGEGDSRPHFDTWVSQNGTVMFLSGWLCGAVTVVGLMLMRRLW